MSNMKTDVVVVGGGVIGCSIAYYLSERGKKVILVERDDYASGATGACDQMVSMQSKTPGIHLRLAMDSINMYKELSQKLGVEIGFHQDGGMILIETQEEMKVMEDICAKNRNSGLDVNIIDRNEAAKIQKGLAEDIIGVAYSKEEGHVDPFRLNFAYANAAVRNGVEILLHTEVTDIETKGGCVERVITNKGPIEAPIVINACGAWAAKIAKMIGMDIPIIPRRGQVVITEPVPRFVFGNILSARYIVAKYKPDLIMNSKSRAIQLGVGLALTQSDKNNILIGSTREFVGYDIGNTHEGMTEILKYATRLMPGLKNMNVIRVMSGLRPRTPDGLPLIGFTKKMEGFFMAAGHEGDGIALAPITGKIVADLICDGKTFIDVEALSPDRF